MSFGHARLSGPMWRIGFGDERGDLPLEAQVKLLHVLQYREIERIGGGQAVPLDIRIIAATDRDLAGMVRVGEFRQGAGQDKKLEAKG
ncbi:MAG: sigma 54-interacting transcriptional regulator [Thermodesulfobacteriota bacterium]